jgi:hypothetical protein
MGTPLIRIRSRTATRCGEVYKPTQSPKHQQKSAHIYQVQRTNFPLWFRMAEDRVYEGTSRSFALRPGYVKYVERIKIVLLTHV